MIMSIVHRITGAALYFGTVILAVWLMTAATSASGFAAVHGFLGSWLGQLVLIGYSWALLHHMFGGIRHFVWDTGRGFGAHERYLFAVLTLVGSVLSTGLIWVVVYSVR